jgi:Domain of unknown function (DUF5010)
MPVKQARVHIVGRKALLLAVALVLIALAATACKNDSGSPGASTVLIGTPLVSNKIVATYFYYWYDLPSGPHSTLLTDHPAEPDPSYQDVSWFKKQLTDMSDADIDIALAVYWWIKEPSSDIGLRNMSQAWDELVADGKAPPAIGMFLDTGAIGQFPADQRDLTKLANQERVYTMIKTWFDIVPERQRATIDGRPVIWLWATWFDNFQFDGSFFDYVISHFQADYGVRPYIVAEEGWGFEHVGSNVDRTKPMPVDTLYNWGASQAGFKAPIGSVAEVGPGYDERQLPGPGRSGRYTPREDGDFYRRNFELAAQSGVPIIAIETWNEFHEASDIADSVEYGRQYIDLTRQLVEAWKGTSSTPSP